MVFIGIFVYRKNKINFKLNKPNVTKGKSLERMHKLGKIFTCFLHKIFRILKLNFFKLKENRSKCLSSEKKV